MSETTNIAWATSTFNPWIGCTKVSPGCDHCYAAVSTPARTLGVKWGAGEPRRRTSASNWKQPLAWNRKARASGKPWRVFCGSLCDVFDNEVPASWREDLFEVIRATPALTWMLLTKRVGNVEDMLPGGWYARSTYPNGPWPNVWIGATVVNQEEADRDIPKLLEVPAAVRFLSLEPMLGPINLRAYLDGVEEHGLDERMKPGACVSYTPPVDWVIVGGESAQPGHRARPFNVEWARDIVRQCKEAWVPCFVKQLGSAPGSDNMFDFDATWAPSMEYPIALPMNDRAGAEPSEWPVDLRVREFPKG